MSQGAADWYIKKPFILAVLGTSLTAGRLSGNLWWMRLMENARAQPEAVGPVILQNFGQGSQQSTYGVARAPDIAAFNPTHVLTEGFAINDCAALPTVISRPDHMANMQTIHDTLKAKNPAVDITWQTMNGVSAAGAALRPLLQDYYDDEVTKAAAMGDRMLDHYYGLPTPPAVVGGWPKPLPEYLTDNGDGLHPIWDGALEVYFWPGMIYWLRVRMAEWWGLPIPNPPEPPPLPDANYLVVGGGGGGGGATGGGGGAGGVKRGVTNLSNLYGPVTIGAAGAPGASRNNPGLNGTFTTLGVITADGGGGGGAYSSTMSLRIGRDGASGGGGGDYDTPGAGGAGVPGQGNPGGQGYGYNGASGGGGGARGVGSDATSTSGGQGGAPYVGDVPGYTFDCAAGGPGGAWTGTRPAYRSGAGPGSYGGGGYGGNPGGGSEGPGQIGGAGVAFVWYPGEPRATGGTITSFGGFTVHRFTANGNLTPL